MVEETTNTLLARLDEKVSANADKMDDLKQDVRGLDGKLDDLTERTVRLESDMDAHKEADESLFKTVNSKFGRMYWIMGVMVAAVTPLLIFILNTEFQILEKIR